MIRGGLPFGVGAYLIWGVLPLYWPLLEPASPLEILAARVVWSLVFVALALTVSCSWAAVRAIISDRRQLRLLVMASVAVTANWGLYIWGVNTGHVIETSLGYFINPLLTILLGVVVLGERLRRAQSIAVGIGALAVVVLTVAYGRLPWIALGLSCSFALYGLLKKRAAAGAIESLAVETGVMTVPAVITLLILGEQGTLAFGHHGAGNAALLAASGIVTAIPLALFAAAATRLPLSTVGQLQYLAPILQFAVGVGIDHEAMPAARWGGFALVWVALIVLVVDGIRHRPVRPAAVPSAVAAQQPT